jgi:hypothetical protein
MQASGINKILRRSLILLLILFAADRLLAIWLEKSFYRQKHGDDLVTIYTLEHTNDDMLILGGSRASHNYRLPDMEVQTGLSCFNGGRDNMGIVYIRAILNVVLQRHTPKVLVLDLTQFELEDFLNGHKLNIQRTSTALLPFAHRYPQLYPTIQLANKYEPLKAAISHVYPYNSLIGAIVQNTYTRLGHTSVKGYEPLSGHIDSANYKVPIWGASIRDYPLLDENIQALKDVIAMAKAHHIRLIACISPYYFPLPSENTTGCRVLRQIISENGFELYDFSNHPAFLKHPALFEDDLHLNDSGAAIYSRMVADLVKGNAPADTAISSSR